MRLIVGLGNPGKEYEKTRHNVGFMSLDYYAKSNSLSFNKNKFSGEYSEFTKNGEKVILLKPGKYMNLSGEVVRDYVNFFKIPIENILVICDDLDTPVGTFRLRYKGSSGGHNGLKNIEQNIGTSIYKRIKIGISNNKLIDTKDYVLGKFSNEECAKLNEVIENIPYIIDDYLINDFEKVMSKYNGKK